MKKPLIYFSFLMVACVEGLEEGHLQQVNWKNTLASYAFDIFPSLGPAYLHADTSPVSIQEHKRFSVRITDPTPAGYRKLYTERIRANPDKKTIMLTYFKLRQSKDRVADARNWVFRDEKFMAELNRLKEQKIDEIKSHLDEEHARIVNDVVTTTFLRLAIEVDEQGLNSLYELPGLTGINDNPSLTFRSNGPG